MTFEEITGLRPGEFARILDHHRNNAKYNGAMDRADLLAALHRCVWIINKLAEPPEAVTDAMGTAYNGKALWEDKRRDPIYGRYFDEALSAALAEAMKADPEQMRAWRDKQWPE